MNTSPRDQLLGEERVVEQLVGGDEAHQESALDHRQDLRRARVRVRRVLPAGDEVDARQRASEKSFAVTTFGFLHTTPFTSTACMHTSTHVSTIVIIVNHHLPY
jgi:hypothetical protein